MSDIISTSNKIDIKALQKCLAATAKHNLAINAGKAINELQAMDLAAHLVMALQNFARKRKQAEVIDEEFSND